MFWKKLVYNKFFLASIIMTFLSFAGIIAAKSILPPILPVFFGKPTGSDQLAAYWFLLIIPGASFVITIINIFLNNLVADEFLKKVLAVSSLIISFMAIVTVTKIILLVGFF